MYLYFGLALVLAAMVSASYIVRAIDYLLNLL